MSLRVISAQQVRQLMSMQDCISVMADAMGAWSRGELDVPLRQFHSLGDREGSLYGHMPGIARGLNAYGAKLISLHPANPARGTPTIQGFIALFDYQDGRPLAIIDAAEVTALRTAAASGLATQQLSNVDASTCGIFGTGVQASSHIDAMCAVRPVSEVRIWGRNPERAKDFAAAEAKRTGLAIHAVDSPADAGACDLVCTVTASTTPVLLGEWVSPGAHINLVGAHSLDTREADSALMARAAVYVDSLSATLQEGGDVMLPIEEGVVSTDYVRGEIGEVVNGTVTGREAAEQVTLYNSLGMTAQDLFAASRLLHLAEQENIGSLVEF